MKTGIIGLPQDESDALLRRLFSHSVEPRFTYRHTWLQIARLGFDGNTLTCDRDAEFEINLREPAPEFTAEHVPVIAKC